MGHCEQLSAFGLLERVCIVWEHIVVVLFPAGLFILLFLWLLLRWLLLSIRFGDFSTAFDLFWHHSLHLFPVLGIDREPLLEQHDSLLCQALLLQVLVATSKDLPRVWSFLLVDAEKPGRIGDPHFDVL